MTKSKSDIHGLLSDLENDSNIHAPSDNCWLEEFLVQTIVFFWSPAKELLEIPTFRRLSNNFREVCGLVITPPPPLGIAGKSISVGP